MGDDGWMYQTHQATPARSCCKMPPWSSGAGAMDMLHHGPPGVASKTESAFTNLMLGDGGLSGVGLCVCCQLLIWRIYIHKRKLCDNGQRNPDKLGRKPAGWPTQQVLEGLASMALSDGSFSSQATRCHKSTYCRASNPLSTTSMGL